MNKESVKDSLDCIESAASGIVGIALILQGHRSDADFEHIPDYAIANLESGLSALADWILFHVEKGRG